MPNLVAATSPVIWFTTRATGTVSIGLLTASVVLGILTTTRVSAPNVPRFSLSELHRRVTLIALAFLGLHILSAVVDTYVPIGWLAVVVPFTSAYQRLWIGLGTVAFDLLIAITVTSLLRRRLGPRLFRFVHWLVYACWPIAIAHGIGVGTDLRFDWMRILVGGCVAAVLAAVGWRIWADPYRGGFRTAAPRTSLREAIRGSSRGASMSLGGRSELTGTGNRQ